MNDEIKNIHIVGLNNLEKLIEYKFNDENIITKAMIHTTYANEHNISKVNTNQRLEFLGDSILQIIASEKLYYDFQEADEGLLTRARSLLVCEGSLASVARELQLYKFLLLGKGETKEKMKENNSTLCDTIEALIGAIYVDGGMEEAKKFVYRFILNEENIKLNVKDTDNKDYKTKLQELMVKESKTIEYEVVREKGPAHKKVFYVVCKIDGKVESEACGKNKKEAEQQAAKVILERNDGSKK